MKDEARKLYAEGGQVQERIQETDDQKAKIGLANEYVGKVDALWSASGIGRTTDERIASTKYHPLEKVYVAYELLRIILGGSKSYVGKASTKDKQSTALATIEPKNYYETLGVDENASQAQIETAYKLRQKNLQTDVLEQKLRTQGLSDYEIRIRLEQARREHEYVQEAYRGVGSEESRKYYNEYRRKENDRSEYDQQEQRRSSEKKQISEAQRAYNYQILGVGTNPTQIELRSAYRNLTKELHPDSYLAQIGKRREDLTPEELKELNNREERLRSVNIAYAEVREQEVLSQELAEREKRESPPPQSQGEKSVVITAIPTVPATDATKTATKESANFQKTVAQAGYVTVTPEEVVEYKGLGVVSETTTATQLSANSTSMLQLEAMGVNSEKLDAAVDSTQGLNNPHKRALRGVAYQLNTFEVVNPKLAEANFVANQEPNVSIEVLPKSMVVPQPNQLVLLPHEGGVLQPLMEESLSKVIDVTKGKAEGVLVRTLEKGGVSVTKSAAKKLTTEALKKGGEELLKQGAKLATKAGLKTGLKAALAAAGAPTGGASLVVWLVLEIGERLLKAATKIIRGIFKLFTGKDDFREQVRDLALMAGVFFLTIGAVVPATVSGIVGLGAQMRIMSGGNLVSGISGIFQAFVYGINAIAVAISWPVIASFFITIFLIIFIIVIISNSAFVIPQGGFQFNIGQLNPADLVCNQYQGHTYCFPVVPVPSVLASCAHHDYVATDISLVNISSGVPITVAFTDGEILYASGGDPLAGNAVIQLGDDGYIYSYFHLGLITVNQGDRVTAGQQLGASGSTGNASGLSPMTHFQAMALSLCSYPSTPAACATTYDSSCLAGGGTRSECVLDQVDDFTCPSRIFNLVFGGAISCGPDTANVGCGGPPPAATCYNRPECTQQPFEPVP